jgi:hypothetical protein
MITMIGKSIFFKLYRRPLFVNESERLPLINKRLEETRRYKFVPDSNLQYCIYYLAVINKRRHFTKTASSGLVNHLGTFFSALTYQASTILYFYRGNNMEKAHFCCRLFWIQLPLPSPGTFLTYIFVFLLSMSQLQPTYASRMREGEGGWVWANGEAWLEPNQTIV